MVRGAKLCLKALALEQRSLPLYVQSVKNRHIPLHCEKKANQQIHSTITEDGQQKQSQHLHRKVELIDPKSFFWGVSHGFYGFDLVLLSFWYLSMFGASHESLKGEHVCLAHVPAIMNAEDADIYSMSLCL